MRPVPSNDFILPQPSPSAIFKPLAEGAVLFSTTEEVYFGVNAVGARIWELLPPATETFDQLCRALAEQYSDVNLDRIRMDALKYLDELVASGLAIPRDGEWQGAQALRASARETD